MSKNVAILTFGVLLGYAFPILFVASSVSGRWLAKQWNKGDLAITATVNTIAVLVLLLSLHVMLGVAFMERLAFGIAVGRWWYCGFVIGLFLYGLLPTFEATVRRS